jgi:hypothetical protein
MSGFENSVPGAGEKNPLKSYAPSRQRGAPNYAFRRRIDDLLGASLQDRSLLGVIVIMVFRWHTAGGMV